MIPECQCKVTANVTFLGDLPENQDAHCLAFLVSFFSLFSLAVASTKNQWVGDFHIFVLMCCFSLESVLFCFRCLKNPSEKDQFSPGN